MGYQVSLNDDKLRKGSWLEEEDDRLVMFVSLLGERRWDSLAKVSGLKRSGKSCRLRWLNYLRPNLKHGHITEEEEKIILQLHAQWGNKWSKIARRLPGRTDNEIKNYWKTHLRKKVQAEEEEKLRSNREVSEQDPVSPGSNDDSKFQKLDSEGSSNDEVSEPEKQAGYAAEEIENFAVLSSPYETRISDWISELSTDQTETTHYNEYSSSSTDSFFVNPWWVSDNIDVEEFSCSLW